MMMTCEWMLADEDDNIWDSGCGQEFSLNEGNPHENYMDYCCFCGCKIALPKMDTLLAICKNKPITHDLTALIEWQYVGVIDEKEIPIRLTGWTPWQSSAALGMQKNDYVLVLHKGKTTRYKIINIDYSPNPINQWFANVRGDITCN